MSSELPGEEWRAVVGWAQIYEVSNMGRVRSLDRVVERRSRWGTTTRSHHPGRIRAIPLNPQTGYHHISLFGPGRSTTRSIHRIVLEAFVGRRPAGHQCRHLDGNRTNNRLENLAWGTVAENTQDRDLHGKTCRGEACSQAKLTEQDVRDIRASTASLRDDADRYGVSKSTIWRVRRRRRWAHVD